MFPATRRDALERLQEFIPVSGKYGRDRNHVFPFAHENVSRLSPAIRHGLVTEDEVAAAPLERYAASTLEKFTQEVYWRRYWQSWLSLRPQVWSDYREDLAALQDDLSPEITERMQIIAEGRSELAIMDYFTRELVETGYLHNHARMWWAGWWIHIEQLPWQLGADFFYRHLLDADAASNTLSWRWVAGLQTPGKSYLPRKSNLEKYLPAETLNEHSVGLELLEKPSTWKPESSPSKPEITREELPKSPDIQDAKTVLWIHEDDLMADLSQPLPRRPDGVIVTADEATWEKERFSTAKVGWNRAALDDVVSRAGEKFSDVEVSRADLSELVQECSRREIRQILAMRPEVGLLHDQLPQIQQELERAGISLCWMDRETDLSLRPLATAGFFSFWKKVNPRETS